jgi:hypothetical protein
MEAKLGAAWVFVKKESGVRDPGLKGAAAKLPRSSDEGRPRAARRPLSTPDP